MRSLLPGFGRRSARPQALVVGPYRVHNFGDDLIGAVIATRLRRQGYDVTIPKLGAENARWIGTRFAEDYEGEFERADLVVVGGGGIMSDTAGAKPGASYLDIVSRAAREGRLGEKRLVVTGVGAGPWVRERSRELARDVSDRAEHVGVRDGESHDHLLTLGVAEEKVVEGADIALLTSEYLRFRRRRTRRIGLQYDIAAFLDVHENPRIGQITDAVQAFARANASRSVLVSNGRHRSQLADSAPETPLLRYEELRTFLPRLAEMSAIFTSHLHLAITAYSQRVPCFSLYVREKTRRFYDQIGHPERAVDLCKATPADFRRLIREAEHATWTTADEKRLAGLKTESAKLLALL